MEQGYSTQTARQKMKPQSLCELEDNSLEAHRLGGTSWLVCSV